MILQGDCLARLAEIPDESVHCVVTSPPYFGLRDYGFDGQIGLEETPEAYVAKLVEVFREVRRVLRGDGVLWLNLGDSYASGGSGGASDKSTLSNQSGTFIGPRPSQIELRKSVIIRKPVGDLKPKDLIGIPWRVAFALQADGWYLRSDIIWAKPNPMPESVTDRCTKSHEYIFMLTKSARYFYDNKAVKEPASYAGCNPMRKSAGEMERQLDPGLFRTRPHGRTCGYPEKRNRRDVWTISTKPYRGAHFATFPPEIPEICIKAGTSERGCCPVCGAPWVRVVERTPMEVRTSEKGKIKHANGLRTSTSGTMTKPPTAQTIGFSPSCSCGRDPVPCTVLDPFAGSGTTGAVAKSLGRDYILIEANPDYIELIEARLAAAERPPATLEDFAP